MLYQEVTIAGKKKLLEEVSSMILQKMLEKSCKYVRWKVIWIVLNISKTYLS